jgi:hypothetical protein
MNPEFCVAVSYFRNKFLGDRDALVSAMRDTGLSPLRSGLIKATILEDPAIATGADCQLHVLFRCVVHQHYVKHSWKFPRGS